MHLSVGDHDDAGQRSGGVLASALLRSAKRLVPDGGLAGRPARSRDPAAPAGSVMLPSLASRSRSMAASAPGGRRASGSALSSTTTMATLARLSRCSSPQRRVGRAQAAARRATAARSSAPRDAAYSSSDDQHGSDDRSGPEERARQHRREIDRPVHAVCRHCPSLSSSAGTCTWSAL